MKNQATGKDLDPLSPDIYSGSGGRPACDEVHALGGPWSAWICDDLECLNYGAEHGAYGLDNQRPWLGWFYFGLCGR